MKLKFNLLMIFAVLFMAACSDDDEPAQKTPAEKVAGQYDGYSVAVFQYSSIPWTTAAESFTVAANEDGTGTLTFNSKIWGRYLIADAAITLDGSNYKVTGSGTTSIAMTGEPTDFDYTLAGTISSDLKTVSLVFTLPVLMGGTTVTFELGEAPANMVVAKSYSGYSSAMHQYIEVPVVTNDETVVITANEDEGTCIISFESEGLYGSYAIPAATVTLENGSYTIAGEGMATLTMNGNAREYDCTIEGTISADKETVTLDFKSTVMGGLTVTFKPGDAPADE